MTRRGRILLAIATLFLLLVIAAAGASTWLMTTRAGFDWAVERGRAYLPEQVTFAEAEGRLIGPITVRGLRVDTEGTRVRVSSLRLRWRPGDLLRGRIGVEYLGLRAVDVEQRPAPPETDAAPPELPSRIGLPLPVTIDHLVVDGAVLRTPEAEPRRLDRLRARVEADSDALHVRGLELVSPIVGADADLRLGLSEPYPVEGRVAWQAESLGPVAAMAGELVLGGSLEDLRLEQRWREPTAATLTAELRLFGATPEWQAELNLPTTALSAWSPAAPELDAGAQLQLSGSFERASVSGAVDVVGLPVGPLRARLEAEGDFAARRLALEHLRVEPTRPDAWLSASGTAALADGAPRVDLALAWNDLAWPLTVGAEPAATSRRGRMHVEGTPDDYRFEGGGRAWTPALQEEAALDWRGQGSTGELERLQATVRWRGARLEADGALDWSDTHTARFDFGLHEVEPGRFDPSLSGRLEADGSIRAQWAPTLSASLDLRDLSGELNGRPVDGRARAAWRDARLHIESLDLAAGDSRLQASGGVEQERVSLDWSLDVPQLSQLLPRAAGSLRASGSVSGAASAPSARFRLSGSGLEFEDLRVDSVQASGEIAQAGEDASRIGVRLREVEAGGARIGLLEAGLRGTRDDHRLVLDVEAPQATAGIVATGGFDGENWLGRLQQAEVTPPVGGTWNLTGPADLAWRAPRFTLAQACWRSDGARICAEGGGRVGDWRATLNAVEVPLALVGNHWRDDLSYDGRFGLSVDLAQSDGPVTGEARLDVTPGRIQASIGDTTTTLIEFGSGRVRATLAPERLDALLELPLEGGGEIAASVGVGRAAPNPLAGQVRAQLRDLDLAAELAPQIGEVEGALTANLELGGTLAAPSVSGEADLREGRVSLPDLGVALREVDVSARTSDGAVSLQASLRSGGGRLSATMELSHEGERGWQGSGTVAGADFMVADLPELDASVTPDLQWSIDGREVSIRGRVEVPEARIEPRDLSNAVQSSPDTVVVRPGTPGPGGESAEEEIPGWRVSADVRVVLGDSVRINAFGLDADLGGDIRIVQRPGQLTNATGELNVIEGTYTIYRQTLTIERGRVLFASGPLSDPGLDVRAVRRPRNVLVGVNVRGTLRQPRIELFSEPPMEESQVLSYLVVGLPLGETSSGERSSVAAAAAALASSRQGERLAQEFGIDEVTVEPEEEGKGASLVLGRYLSPRLYVGYGIGLLEQADSVRVRYELTQQWTLETRSGATSSADLLYSIEGD